MKRIAIIAAAVALSCASAGAQSRQFTLGKWVEVHNAILKELSRSYVDSLEVGRIERTGVDAMLEEGLVEEARSLLPHRDLPALNTVGYKELFGYFDGEYDLAEAVRLIKRNTRHYAKKQMTWWGRDPEIKWISL